MTDEQKQKQPEAKADAKQPEAKAEAKQPEAKAAPAPKKADHTVAEGCTLACKKGVLSAGDEVRAEYLGGGQKALDALVKAGKVDSNK